jgi:hypothetical protein
VAAFLDGQVVSELKTDFRNVSLRDDLKLAHDNSLALMSFQNDVLISAAQVREISGEGKPIH